MAKVIKLSNERQEQEAKIKEMEKIISHLSPEDRKKITYLREKLSAFKFFECS